MVVGVGEHLAPFSYFLGGARYSILSEFYNMLTKYAILYYSLEEVFLIYVYLQYYIAFPISQKNLLFNDRLKQFSCTTTFVSFTQDLVFLFVNKM